MRRLARSLRGGELQPRRGEFGDELFRVFLDGGKLLPQRRLLLLRRLCQAPRSLRAPPLRLALLLRGCEPPAQSVRLGGELKEPSVDLRPGAFRFLSDGSFAVELGAKRIEGALQHRQVLAGGAFVRGRVRARVRLAVRLRRRRPQPGLEDAFGLLELAKSTAELVHHLRLRRGDVLGGFVRVFTLRQSPFKARHVPQRLLELHLRVSERGASPFTILLHPSRRFGVGLVFRRHRSLQRRSLLRVRRAGRPQLLLEVRRVGRRRG